MIISSRSTLVGSLMANCSVFSKQPDPIMYSYTCPTHEQLLWTIRNVTRAHDGNTWRCLVGFTTIGSEEATNTINVQVPIQTVEMFYPTNNVVTIQQNIETVFICRTSVGKPKAAVRWYKDNRTATTNDDIEITTFATTTDTTIGDLIYVTSTLRYSPAKEDSGMKIYCIARNSVDNLVSNRKPELNVQYSPDGPPVIQGFNNTETCYVIENNQSLLSCSSRGGNPLATLSWDCFNSGSTSTSSVESNVTKTVTFSALRGQDRSCTCKSSHPVDKTQSVTVNIEVLCKFTFIFMKYYFTALKFARYCN
ncbi:nephrin-like [Ruditapes philippinarum]|uniref:nephrin-like n=1 Tax=Ruditapes philippinarum TaxID=129788 RepID=UPI00295AFCE8|nr:nephrin-like [Ruditapes philippinarum]